MTISPESLERDIEALRDAVLAAVEGTVVVAPVPGVGPATPRTVVEGIRVAIAPDEPVEDERIRAIVATSGSTGDPVGVCHTAGSLRAGVDSFAAAYPRLRRSPWLLALPPSSAAGFAVVLRSALAGSPLAVLPSVAGARPFDPAEAARALEPHLADSPAISLVPRQLARLLDHDAGRAALGACGLVLVGGGATPAPLAQRARDAGIALRTTYGMTETCGGVVHDGVPLPGVAVTIEPAAEGGRVRIAGEMVALGYRLRPALTAAAFRPGPPPSILTRDLGTWADGRLRIHGRIDDHVKVKGVTVSLGAVEDAARRANGIADAAAVVIPGAGETRIGLALVVGTEMPGGPGPAPEHAALDAIVAALGPAARPAVVRRVDALPLLTGGKIDRPTLARSFDPGPDQTSEA